MWVFDTDEFDEKLLNLLYILFWFIISIRYFEFVEAKRHNPNLRLYTLIITIGNETDPDYRVYDYSF